MQGSRCACNTGSMGGLLLCYAVFSARKNAPNFLQKPMDWLDWCCRWNFSSCLFLQTIKYTRMMISYPTVWVKVCIRLLSSCYFFNATNVRFFISTLFFSQDLLDIYEHRSNLTELITDWYTFPLSDAICTVDVAIWLDHFGIFAIFICSRNSVQSRNSNLI